MPPGAARAARGSTALCAHTAAPCWALNWPGHFPAGAFAGGAAPRFFLLCCHPGAECAQSGGLRVIHDVLLQCIEAGDLFLHENMVSLAGQNTLRGRLGTQSLRGASGPAGAGSDTAAPGHCSAIISLVHGCASGFAPARGYKQAATPAPGRDSFVPRGLAQPTLFCVYAVFCPFAQSARVFAQKPLPA